jgi:hypothetical protein
MVLRVVMLCFQIYLFPYGKPNVPKTECIYIFHGNFSKKRHCMKSREVVADVPTVPKRMDFRLSKLCAVSFLGIKHSVPFSRSLFQNRRVGF